MFQGQVVRPVPAPRWLYGGEASSTGCSSSRLRALRLSVSDPELFTTRLMSCPGKKAGSTVRGQRLRHTTVIENRGFESTFAALSEDNPPFMDSTGLGRTPFKTAV